MAKRDRTPVFESNGTEPVAEVDAGANEVLPGDAEEAAAETETAEPTKELSAEELRLRYLAAREMVGEAMANERGLFEQIQARVAAKYARDKAANPKAPAPVISLAGERYQLRRGRGDAGMYLDKLGPVEVVDDF